MVGNLESCALMLFTDADFAGNLRDSKSTNGLFMAMVGPNTFHPLGAVSKTQTAVSHSSTDAEVIALDHAIRVEGLPAITFWEFVRPLFTSNDSQGGSKRDFRNQNNKFEGGSNRKCQGTITGTTAWTTTKGYHATDCM